MSSISRGRGSGDGLQDRGRGRGSAPTRGGGGQQIGGGGAYGRTRGGGDRGRGRAHGFESRGGGQQRSYDNRGYGGRGESRSSGQQTREDRNQERRSGGGYGGARGRGNVADVRALAQRVEIDPKLSRESHGSKGTPIELIANHYSFGFEDMSCFHYDIEIGLRRSDGKIKPIVGPKVEKIRNNIKANNIEVIQQMTTEWVEVFRGRVYIFDGQKNLYCGQELAIGSEAVRREVGIQLDGYREQTFEVMIKFVGKVLMNRVVNEFNEAKQVLEIGFRYIPTQTHVVVGRNLYSRTNRVEISGANAQIGMGRHQSVHLTECGYTLNIDRVSTLFRGAGTLIEFIERELNIEDLSVIPFNQQLLDRINPKIKGLKISTKHVRNQKIGSFIDRIVSLKPFEYEFEIESSDGSVVKKNVEQYFLDEYKKPLIFRNIPLILLKGGYNKRYLPVEVCDVYPDQPVPKYLETQDMRDKMMEMTGKQRPIERFQLIQESMEAIANESQEFTQSFGIETSLKPIRLTGRVLPKPRLEGSDRRFKDSKSLHKWLFINMSVEVHRNLRHYFNQFFNALIRTAQAVDMIITRINFPLDALPHEVKSGPYRGLAAMESEFNLSKGYEMIFFCIPKANEIYSKIKNSGDVRYGIPTQCINDQKFMNTPPGYHKNILFKINAKLNGQNQVLSPSDRPDVFTKAKNRTIVVGVDVVHPGTNPLANERVISSIAASVGSFDPEFSKYTTSVCAQPMNTEIVANFDAMFGQHLQHFMKYNHSLPTSVIVFRDGVSDGQLQQVVDREIPLIEKAFKRLDPTVVPKITVFVVQKRHNTRFMSYERRFEKFYNRKEDREVEREVHNIPEGTVVDNTIVNPNLNEFHLCSHKGLLGTSRHAKYVCLRDDHNWTEDEKQQLAYNMCFACLRSTSSISIPTPVKYADLAAFRAKDHISAQNIEFEESSRNESKEQKMERELRNITALNESIVVNPNLLALPYYS